LLLKQKIRTIQTAADVDVRLAPFHAIPPSSMIDVAQSKLNNQTGYTACLTIEEEDSNEHD